MKTLTVATGKKSLSGTVRLPASKSISNRVLMIRALSGEDFPLDNLSEADDTALFAELLGAVRNRRGDAVCELDTGNAGTVMRFLTAMLSLKPGTWVLTGSDRMRQRPIAVLVEALNTLGADIEYLAKPGYPPLLVKGRRFRGGELLVDAGISSQYISALMMIAPLLEGGLTLRYSNRPVSLPYIRMTSKLMKTFGVRSSTQKNGISVPEGTYAPAPFTVEADWSSAAFWYEAASLAAGAEILLPGLVENSLQGDSVLPGIFQNLGVETAFTPDGVRLKTNLKPAEGFFFDFTDHPDLAPAVITTCAALGIRGRFEGLNSLRIKETDRIAALKAEYEKLGVKVESAEVTDMLQSIEIAPRSGNLPNPHAMPLFETYGDHRMAMTFAPLALLLGPVRISNPDVVTKSYPGFWKEMVRLGFEVT